MKRFPRKKNHEPRHPTFKNPCLNWYGYRDSLPVVGNLVLAGVTGSGKSILMDLLMLVLVGPERARHHFNRSATGSKSDRTIKGYCLLDTKREENGAASVFP